MLLIFFMPKVALASDGNIVSEFNVACLDGAYTVDFSATGDVDTGWKKIENRSVYNDLDAYLSEIEKMFGANKLSEIVSFHKTVNGEDIFLSKYKSKGQFDTTTMMCMIMDFKRAEWTFPDSLMSVLEGKIIETKFSESIKNQEYSVGIWRTPKSTHPVTKISVNAYSHGTMQQMKIVAPGLQMVSSTILD